MPPQDAVKAIRIDVTTRPKAKPGHRTTTPTLLGRLKTRFFKFVEGDEYTYQAAIRNVGDEAIDPKDLLAVQFRWEFSTGQVNVKGWHGLPERINPGEVHSFPGADHHVLSSGFALLYIHTLREVGGVIGHPPLEVIVLDSRNQPVPFEPTSGIRLSLANIRGETQSSHQEGRSSFAIESFRSLTGAEVNQYILIAVAVAALLLNAAFGVLNYFK